MPASARRPLMLWACFETDPAPWLTAFHQLMPELDIRAAAEIADAGAVDYAFAWKTPEGALDGYPNLKAVFSLGAGVDRLLASNAVPPAVPLVRMVDPGLKEGMNEFVLMQTLFYHRAMPTFAAQQARHLWQDVAVPLPRHRTVGIMGMGELGRYCAGHLARLGFAVRGWARSAHEVSGVTCFAGPEALGAFLDGTQILVCLLPLTPESRGILNEALFARLPAGSFLIHVARGGHLVEADLLAALDNGRLAGATLDVFTVEPLPQDHPFWSHPRIIVTPHASAPTQPETAAAVVVENIRRHRAGLPLLHVVNRTLGY